MVGLVAKEQSLATIPTDGVLPPLVRGEPFALQVYTSPATDFTGLVVAVHLDSQATGTRTTITTITANPLADGIYHATDEASVTATFNDTTLLEDGVDYDVTVVVDGKEWAMYTLPVGTPAGGVV